MKIRVFKEVDQDTILAITNSSAGKTSLLCVTVGVAMGIWLAYGVNCLVNKFCTFEDESIVEEP